MAGGIPLRVMFIGASMTLGEHSTGEVGYRKQIRDWIVSRGNLVNYVGQVIRSSQIAANNDFANRRASRIDTAISKIMTSRHSVPNP